VCARAYGARARVSVRKSERLENTREREKDRRRRDKERRKEGERKRW